MSVEVCVSLCASYFFTQVFIDTSKEISPVIYCVLACQMIHQLVLFVCVMELSGCCLTFPEGKSLGATPTGKEVYKNTVSLTLLDEQIGRASCRERV